MAHILVVDDYPAILAMLRLTLLGAGHEVETAEDGLAGLVAARRSGPDVVLLDVDMPGMDGVAACAELKRDARTRGIPVILMSGRLCMAVIEKARQAGAAGVLRKPFDRALLLEEVEKAIASGSGKSVTSDGVARGRTKAGTRHC